MGQHMTRSHSRPGGSQPGTPTLCKQEGVTPGRSEGSQMSTIDSEPVRLSHIPIFYFEADRLISKDGSIEKAQNGDGCQLSRHHCATSSSSLLSVHSRTSTLGKKDHAAIL